MNNAPLDDKPNHYSVEGRWQFTVAEESWNSSNHSTVLVIICVCSTGWLAGFVFVRLAGWLALCVCPAGWLCVCPAGWLAGFVFVQLAGWLALCFVHLGGWLALCLSSQLAGCISGLLSGVTKVSVLEMHTNFST